MFVYSIGYYSFEESHYFQMMHEERFSEEQLEEKVLACLPDLVKRIWNDKLYNDWMDPDDDERAVHVAQSRLRIDFPDVMRGCYACSDEEIKASLEDLLCERFGFIPVVFETTYHRFGWGDLVAGDWDYEDHDEAARARLVAAVRSSFTEYIEQHPDLRDRFGFTDVAEFVDRLHKSRCGDDEEDPSAQS